MNHHTAVATILTRLADTLDRDRRLTPDQAMNKALIGIPNSAAAHDEAISALETATGRRGQGLDRIPRPAAILAARTEAARHHRYGDTR